MTSTCPVCQSNNLTHVGEKNRCMVSRCQDCATYFVSQYDPKVSAAIYDDYIHTPAYARKPEKKMRRGRRRLAWLKAKCGGTRFLDIGCNVGFAVEAAREAGYEAHGYDIDAAAIEQARTRFAGCHFHSGELDQVVGTFDVIYCAEVIEHVPDPHAFARQLFRLLAPGGTLFLTTPDSGHWRRTRDFMRWPEVIPPEHLVWFNKKSLAQVLTRAGFKAVRYRLNFKAGIRALARSA